MSESAISGSILAKLPASVRDELATMPREKQEKYATLYAKRSKKVLLAYALCVLYGLHFVYLEDIETGVWFWLTLGAFFIWWIIELFRIYGKVRRYNSHAAIIALADVKAGE